jgi:hypothetical protein
MKKLKLITLLLVGLALNSCSSVKVVDAWKTPNIEAFRDNKILVVARTANREAREAFEREITDKLLARGFNATPSYTIFPKLRPNDKLTKERKEEIKGLLQKEGFNGVVLSVLKDYQERTRYIGEGAYEASVSYGYTDWPSYVGGGFYTYYVHPLSYATAYVDVDAAEIAITAKLYVLETVAYDLEQPEKNQLVALINAAIENPATAKGAAHNYADAIAKRLKKTTPASIRK